MKKIITKVLFIILIIVIVISGYFIYNNTKEDKEQEVIFEEIEDIAEKNEDKDIEEIQTNEKSEEKINMKKLYSINNDIVGWIKIDNTNINYPVMQTKNSPNFYLRKNFYKQYSYWGTPYLSENCDINTSDNLIIYGHHINNTKMFGELEKYKNKSFYNKHQIIKLYTMNSLAEYEIYSVLKTVAYYGFQYYNYVSFDNKDEFDTFTRECKKLSFFGTKQEVKYGDKFITLSTCEYSKKDGRLVVVAKKIK